MYELTNTFVLLPPNGRRAKRLRMTIDSDGEESVTPLGGRSRASVRASHRATLFEYASLGSTKEPSQYRNENGAASLETMAMHKLLANLWVLTPDTLRDVPWVLANRIWRELCRHDLQSLRVWQAFIGAYPEELTIGSHKTAVLTPDLPLSRYLRPLSIGLSPWISFLSIVNVQFSRSEFLNIMHVDNLAMLHITYEDLEKETSPVDDSLIRAWCENAKSAGKLSRLTHLILAGNVYVTQRSFEYITAFPSLKLYIVPNTYMQRDAEQVAKLNGWITDDLPLKAFRNDTKSAFWHKGMCNLYETTGTAETLPVLSLRLGTGNPLIKREATRCFQRGIANGQAELSSPMACDRAMPGTNIERLPSSRKGKTIRPSKHRMLESMLSDFA